MAADAGVIESVFYELGMKAEQLKAESKAVVAAEDAVAASAQRAEDAMTALVDQMLQTAEGAARVEQLLGELSSATDEVTGGMTAAASGSEKFAVGLRTIALQQQAAAQQSAALGVPLDRITAGLSAATTGSARFQAGLRLLAQQQAAARVQAEQLTAPLDRITAGLSASTSGSAKFEVGLRRLAEANRAVAGTQTQVTAGAESNVHAANKARAGLVALALGATQTSGAVGNLVQGLLLFGAGSGLVAGVAAGVAVIATLYNKVTEEARKTKEAADAVRESIKQSLSTPVGVLFDQIATAQKALEQLRAKAAERIAFKPDGTVLTRGEADPSLRTEIAQREADLGTLIRQKDALQASNRAEASAIVNDLKQQASLLQQAIATRATLGLDTTDLQRQLGETTRILAGVSAVPANQQATVKAALERDVAARNAALAQARTDLAKTFAQQLPDTINLTVEAITTLGAKLTALEAAGPEVAAGLQPLIARLLELRTQAETLDLTQALALDPAQAIEALDQIRSRIVAQLPADADVSPEALALRARLADIDAKRAIVNEKLVAANQAQAAATGEVADNSGEIATATAKTLTSTAAIVRQVSQVARGAIGVAQAFGLAGDSTAAFLQNIVSAADALPGLIAQVQTIGKVGADGKSLFDLSSFVSSTTAFLGAFAGIASSLFGPSQSDLQAQQIQKDNTDALLRLTAAVESDLPGGKTAATIDLIGGIAGVDPKRLRLLESQGNQSALNPGELARQFRALGVEGDTAREVLDAVARQLHDIDPSLSLNFGGTVQEFEDSLKAVQAALDAIDFKAFTESFAGQVSLLQARADLLDLTDPIDQLRAMQEAAKGQFGNPLLADQLGGLDLTDPAQRAEADRRILALFDRLDSGVISGTELGGLSAQEFADFLAQFETTIDALNQQSGQTTGAGGGATTVGVLRSITDVQADRLISLAITQDLHLVEIRDLLAAALTTPAFVPAPQPAQVSALTGPGPTGAPLRIDLTMRVVVEGGAADATTARTIGEAAGVASAQAVAQLLGDRLGRQRLLAGDVVVH